MVIGDGRVHCFTPDGTLVGKTLVPEVVSNLCFGGLDGRRLLMAATSSVFGVFFDETAAEPLSRDRTR